MKALDRIVTIAEITAVACIVVFVVLLFTNKPDVVTAAADADGATVYAANCAGCHGVEGQGGLGLPLGSGAVVASLPDINDEIAVITAGRALMPAWEGQLTPAQIEAVAQYTRDELGR